MNESRRTYECTQEYICAMTKDKVHQILRANIQGPRKMVERCVAVRVAVCVAVCVAVYVAVLQFAVHTNIQGPRKRVEEVCLRCVAVRVAAYCRLCCSFAAKTIACTWVCVNFDFRKMRKNP